MQKKNQQKTHQRNPHQHKNEQHDAYRRWKTMQNMLIQARADLYGPALCGASQVVPPDVPCVMIRTQLVPTSLVHENRVTGETTNFSGKLVNYNGNYSVQFTGQDGSTFGIPCTPRIVRR